MHLTQHYLSILDHQKDSMFSLLEKWAAINSGSENYEGLEKMIAQLKKDFMPLGGKIEELSLRPRLGIDNAGNPVQIPHGRALHIQKHPQAKLQVFLGGHMDTVYPKDSPFQTTRLVHHNQLNGPGVADMKGGLVILLKSLECLESSPFAGKIGWEVLINSDEEVGSAGSEPILIQCAKRNQLGLIFEPSYSDGTLVSSRKGSANYTIVCKGKAAHAGRDFFLGKNAITALADAILKIEGLTDKERGITVNVGFIIGGGPTNIVPDHALCRINVRTVEKHQNQSIHLAMEKILEEENKTKGMECTLYPHHVHAPKLFDEKQKKLFEQMASCGKKLGIEIKWKPSGGACDGNVLAAQGLPVIDTMGAVGGNIHTSDEYIEVDSLLERSRLTALFLMNLAGEKDE